MCADNTGGLVTDAVLLHVMNTKARIVICGQISQYNTGLDQPATGPRFLHRVLFTRATIQGILYFDWEDRLDEMIQQMLVWIQQGIVFTNSHPFFLIVGDPPLLFSFKVFCIVS